jgi:hypothetical protein
VKSTLSTLNTLFISAALTTLLAGCGGGGDDGPAAPASNAPPGSATPVPAPPASTPVPPAPVPSGTGLSNPSLALTLNDGDAVMLARKMADASSAAAGAAATLQLGALDPGTREGASPWACPEGGAVSHEATAPNVQRYTYGGCQVNGYTFNGTSTVSSNMTGGTLNSFTVDFNLLQVAAAGAPTSVSGQLRCQLPATAGAAPACVSSYATFVWGWDTTLTAEGVNGTHQCSCASGTWNVAFDKFTGTSGTAYVYATNGTAVVTRSALKVFRVVLTVEGETRAFDVVLN